MSCCGGKLAEWCGYGVGYGETEVRRQIKEAGGVWDAERKPWRVSGHIAHAMKLQKRIIKDAQ